MQVRKLGQNEGGTEIDRKSIRMSEHQYVINGKKKWKMIKTKNNVPIGNRFVKCCMLSEILQDAALTCK